MLAQRTAHDVVGELLIVAAVLGREQLESRELGLCLIAEAVDALAVRKVVFLTADHEHASLSREQEIHQTGARAAEGIVVRADVAQSARLRQVGVEGHDRDLGGQLHHPRAHTRILCRRQRQSVHAKLDQLVDRSQLALCVNALNGAHIDLRAGRGQLRLRAHDLLENHVHEHGLDRLDDDADLDRVFRKREQTPLTVGPVAQFGCDAAHTIRDLRVNAAAIVEGAVDRAARGDFYQSNCHFLFPLLSFYVVPPGRLLSAPAKAPLLFLLLYYHFTENTSGFQPFFPHSHQRKRAHCCFLPQCTLYYIFSARAYPS